ncbi:four helix bundle protein [candidate division WOR-3 bacterium]|nr:four helix bundle protein [candidate division WOR-3 bacterium]
MVDKWKVKSFEDLIVWQKAHQLVLEIYKITDDFPSEEKFGLVSQMRRAVVSVPANITEGFRKRGIKDKLNFYNIAQGSLDELNYYIILSKDLGYMQANKRLLEQIKEVAKLLSGLIKSIGGKR